MMKGTVRNIITAIEESYYGESEGYGDLGGYYEQEDMEGDNAN